MACDKDAGSQLAAWKQQALWSEILAGNAPHGCWRDTLWCLAREKQQRAQPGPHAAAPPPLHAALPLAGPRAPFEYGHMFRLQPEAAASARAVLTDGRLIAVCGPSAHQEAHLPMEILQAHHPPLLPNASRHAARFPLYGLAHLQTIHTLWAAPPTAANAGCDAAEWPAAAMPYRPALAPPLRPPPGGGSGSSADDADVGDIVALPGSLHDPLASDVAFRLLQSYCRLPVAPAAPSGSAHGAHSADCGAASSSRALYPPGHAASQVLAAAAAQQLPAPAAVAVVLPAAAPPLAPTAAGAAAAADDGGAAPGSSSSQRPKSPRPRLHRLTYLDVSNHGMGVGAPGGDGGGSGVGLGQEQLAAVLARHGQHLRHLVAAGTAVGPSCLRLLGSGQAILQLQSLDLSAPLLTPASHGGAPAGAGAKQAHAPEAVSYAAELHAALSRLTGLTALRLCDSDLRGVVVPAAAPANNPSGRAAASGQGSGGGSGKPRVVAVGMWAPPGDKGGALAAAAAAHGGANPAGKEAARQQQRHAAAAGSGAHGARSTAAGAAGGGCSAGAPAPREQLLQPLVGALSGLRHLDLSGCSGLDMAGLAAILQQATQLTQLRVARCKDLAWGPWAPVCGATAPALRVLAAGWGFDGWQLQRLLLPTLGAGNRSSGCSSAGEAAAELKRNSACHGAYRPSGDGSRGDKLLAAGNALSGSASAHQGSACTPAGAPLPAPAAALRPPQPRVSFATALDLEVGASIRDEDLLAVASSCPHLQRVRLVMCSVSDLGVGALLAGCPKVHALHVINCVGPFGPRLLQPLGWLQGADPDGCFDGVSCADSSRPFTAAAGAVSSPLSSPPPPPQGSGIVRWRISDLQMTGGPFPLTDCQLLSLLCGRSTLAAAAAAACAPLHTPPSLAPTSPAAATDPAAAPARQPLPLHTLALVNWPLLSLGLLRRLQELPATGLQHVRLEQCGYECGAVAPEPAALGGAVAAGGAWHEDDLMGWLGSNSGLRSLRLRHCCKLGRGFVEALAEHCPLLEALMVDACDLCEGGFAAQPDSYGALKSVQVAKCAAAASWHGSAAAASGAGGTREEAGGVWWHRCEKSVHVHDLANESTAVQPLFRLR